MNFFQKFKIFLYSVVLFNYFAFCLYALFLSNLSDYLFFDISEKLSNFISLNFSHIFPENVVFYTFFSFFLLMPIIIIILLYLINSNLIMIPVAFIFSLSVRVLKNIYLGHESYLKFFNISIEKKLTIDDKTSMFDSLKDFILNNSSNSDLAKFEDIYPFISSINNKTQINTIIIDYLNTISSIVIDIPEVSNGSFSFTPILIIIFAAGIGATFLGYPLIATVQEHLPFLGFTAMASSLV